MEAARAAGLYPARWTGLPEKSRGAGGWGAVSAKWEVREVTGFVGAVEALAEVEFHEVGSRLLVFRRHIHSLS